MTFADKKPRAIAGRRRRHNVPNEVAHVERD